ncbi:MAG: TonB-dependent receptor plug domain-containing protein, partial [Chitinophagales bacterium]
QNNDSTTASYQFGYDINIENGQGERFTQENGNAITLGEAALFTAVSWKPSANFALQPAIRYGYHSKYKVLPTPSLSMKTDFGKGFTYRASYGMGFRSPNLKELYLNFVDKNHRIFGNEDLTPELSHNVNTSFQYRGSKKIHKYQLKTSFFFNHKYDAIALFSSSDNSAEFRYTNVGEYQTMGVQIEGQYKVKDFSIGTGFGYFGKHNKTQNLVEQKFRFSPEWNLQASYDIKRIGLNLSLYNKLNGKQEAFALDSETNEIQTLSVARYNIMDLTASKSFWENRLKIQVGAKNIFDVTTAAASGGSQSSGAHSSSTGTLISTGRSYFIGLKIGGKS